MSGEQPAYKGKSGAVHVEVGSFDSTPVGPNLSDPVLEGRAVKITTHVDSPAQFHADDLYGPTLGQPSYKGQSMAVHVFGTSETFPTIDPISPCGTPPEETETFLTRDYNAQVAHVQGNDARVDAFGLEYYVYTAGLTSFQANIFDAGGGNGADPLNGPSGDEVRFFVSHNAPTGATSARFRCEVYGWTISPPYYANDAVYDWVIYLGTFGAGTPSWGNVGAVVATGTVSPNSLSFNRAAVVLVDEIVPVIDGRIQLVLSFGGQPRINIGLGAPLSDYRYPLISLGSAQEHLITAEPGHITGHQEKYYQLDYFHCADDFDQPLLPFTPGYMPTFRRQIGDPTTTLDSYICTFESAAMVLDWHTRGAVKVWGGELIPWSGRTESSIFGNGSNLSDSQQAWRHWNQYLEIRSGQTFADMLVALSQGRAVILQGEYGELQADEKCSTTFVAAHAISVYPYKSGDRWLEGDPICSTFRGVRESSLQAYSEAFGVLVYGVTSPQKILFAVSRPWVP